ncbi:[FeFe] hydrogenase H-cluster radical SAM maturase HydG [uncultured Tyzzerella sp.]|uniref:[FeFe] hydrogenase H-cluster radical SAM maturase HydG n=1 Tax=uncultured Tyzzerella sp. TaxID=2321398 RepID=UPI00294225A5|nr:[FeFe] hydrogenase H-cluster radical SAM maturase HydG [uncultured Tyzzerella sp.]
MYNKYSKKAQEFINDKEILQTIEWVKENVNNKNLINDVLEKAKNLKGIDHREALLLLECPFEDLNEEIYNLAKYVKNKIYGKRVVLFAPIYLSNYCVNGCVYCSYNYKNKDITRRKLTQDEIVNEVKALQDMGHKRLALELGEDPVNNSIDYVLESINTIYSVKHKNGVIRRVNVNIAATSVENYKKLKEAEIGTYVLFQETYNKENYEKLHPFGPKHNYDYHTEAMDRAMEAGLDDVGIGVLFGLNMYRYDFVGLLMHAEHLEATMGVGPHTVSVPRIKDGNNVDSSEYSDAISDELFKKIIAILRITMPYVGIIVSTRESQEVREKTLEIGVSQISGGSKTSVGGYTTAPEENTEQFSITDERTLEEIVEWLLKLGYVPSFCTACYREGRTGDRFMQLAKSGQIVNCCNPNSLITLKEYVQNYALENTKRIANKVIEEELKNIPNEKVKCITTKYLQEMCDGNQDFRF